jgi:hypothetical protein
LLLPAALPAIAQEQPPASAVSPKVDAAPKPDVAPQEREPESTVSLGLNYWLGGFKPVIRTGRTSAAAQPSDLDFPGNPKGANGATLSIPAGEHNSLRFSYFRVQGHGNMSAPADLDLFSTGYTQGDYLATSYTLQNAKVSLDFLSWPFPVGNSKFRVKTLWEVQYTTIRSGFAAPLKVSATGDFTDTSSQGSESFVYPSLGMGIEHLTSKNFRWGAKASGFAIPHRPVLWDADTYAAYRRGQIEFTAGARAFHFKTSPQREQYLGGTLSGAYVGLRYYLKY